MKLNVFLLSILATATVISGCGKDQSDPVKDYRGLNVTRPTGEVRKDQTIEDASPFKIRVLNNTNDEGVANFVEGETGTVQIGVQVLDHSITEYRLELIEKPQGVQLSQAPNEPNVFLLTYTPQIGVVDKNVGYREEFVKFYVYITNTNDVRRPKGDVKMLPLKLFITKNRQQPEITGINGLPETIEEGQTVTFSVDVNDPVSREMPVNPKLNREIYEAVANLENYTADGTQFLTPSAKVENLKNGSWRIYYTLDASGYLPLPLNKQGKPDFTADHLSACFTLRAESSVTGNKSAAVPKCVVIRYASQTPEFNFDSADTFSQVNAGKQNTLKFTVSTSNKRGEVQVKNATQGFANWPGSPTLNCVTETNNPAVQACVLTWDVPCRKATTAKSSYTLNLKALSRLNGKTKNASQTREIRVVQTVEACPVEAAVEKTNSNKKAVKPASEKPTADKKTEKKTTVEKSVKPANDKPAADKPAQPAQAVEKQAQPNEKTATTTKKTAVVKAPAVKPGAAK